jgi:RimJ/RimL family protein N-acetyltransferase
VPAAPPTSDLDLLRLEIETLWPLDARGRISTRRAPDFVLASTAAGLAMAVGPAVPDQLAAMLAERVQRAAPAQPLSSPPPILDDCRQRLAETLGPLELLPGSGPSYLIHERVEFPSSVPLICSTAQAHVATLAGANPGNWEPDEWQQLLGGQLGPWAMAVHAGEVISICHTPVSSPLAAEAGVWTRPEFRGRGHAAAVTAAWAALLRPSGRLLFYSTARTNVSSQRVAARLGLRHIGWLWQLARPAS